jgi:hypothetical protein
MQRACTIRDRTQDPVSSYTRETIAIMRKINEDLETG